MGLPRVLETGLRLGLPNVDKFDLLTTGFIAGHKSSYRMRRALVEASKLGVANRKLSLDILRWSHKRKKRPVVWSLDQLTRKNAQLYVGIVQREHGDGPDFRTIEVPLYFLPTLERYNKHREERDREAIELRRKINEIRDRVYSSRAFPPTLKAIIFARDNYTCRLCLRDRGALQKAGLHLECDHILAWEEGGLTTYDNGQTLCSECNKAKHHAKQFFGMLGRFRGDSSKK